LILVKLNHHLAVLQCHPDAMAEDLVFVFRQGKFFALGSE